MKDKSIPIQHQKDKPCVCRLAPQSKLFLRPTHQHNDEGLAEFKCWLCGRTAYQPA